MLGAPGWPTIVWQQHSLDSHRLSTARTAQHPRAVLTNGWRWQRLNSDQLEQLQLAAQAREAAAIAKPEQAVVAHFDEAFGQDMLQEPTQELLDRKGAVCRLTTLANAVAEGDLLSSHA